MNIGFCWSGSTSLLRDKFRSTPLDLWAPLFAAPDTTWHSLVLDIAPPDAPNVIDHREELQDVEDTARLMAGLDLIITVDTMCAHLAGVLNLPTWLLVYHPPEWRWGQVAESTPWYPSAKLYRQPAAGAWQPVFDRIALDLTRRVHIQKVA